MVCYTTKNMSIEMPPKEPPTIEEENAKARVISQADVEKALTMATEAQASEAGFGAPRAEANQKEIPSWVSFGPEKIEQAVKEGELARARAAEEERRKQEKAEQEAADRRRIADRMEELHGKVHDYRQRRDSGELTTAEYFSGCEAACEAMELQIVVAENELRDLSRAPADHPTTNYERTRALLADEEGAIAEALMKRTRYVQALRLMRDKLSLDNRAAAADEYAAELGKQSAKLTKLLDTRARFYETRPSIIAAAKPPEGRWDRAFRRLFSRRETLLKVPQPPSGTDEALATAREFAAPQKAAFEIPLPVSNEPVIEPREEIRIPEAPPPANMDMAQEIKIEKPLETMAPPEVAQKPERERVPVSNAEKFTRMMSEFFSAEPAYGTTHDAKLEILNMAQKLLDSSAKGELRGIEINGKPVAEKELQEELDYIYAAELNTALDEKVNAFEPKGASKKEDMATLETILAPYLGRGRLGSKQKKEYRTFLHRIVGLKILNDTMSPRKRAMLTALRAQIAKEARIREK